MAKTVVGLFDTFPEAQAVVQDLIDNGFRRDDISIVAGENATGREAGVAVEGETATAEAAGAGAVSGTFLGGAIGLLVGAGLLAIPGIGPVLAAGPLAAAIGTLGAAVGAGALGAGVGAATGGLLGGLAGAGVPKEEAEFYAEGVRRGGTLVAVSVDETASESARDIMKRHAVINIEERSATWRSSGWTGTSTTDDVVNAAPVASSAPQAPVSSSTATTAPMPSRSAAHSLHFNDVRSDTPTAGTGTFDTFDGDFRTHYQTTYGTAGYAYDDYTPVYRYGYSLANDTRYGKRAWNDFEPEARQRWEEHNPGTWEQFKDTIRYAWDKVRSKI